MDISNTSGPNASRNQSSLAGFSLVEVTLAIGIVGFAFVAVFGLLPTGLGIFRQAMDTSVGAQIAQRVINEAQQTDFDELVKDASGKTISGTNTTGVKAVRYFDDQGNELTSKTGAIYWVNTRITSVTTFPGKSASGNQDNDRLATVTVQVANNPAGQTPSISSTNLWGGTYQAASTNTSVVPYTIHTALVARNK